PVALTRSARHSILRRRRSSSALAIAFCRTWRRRSTSSASTWHACSRVARSESFSWLATTRASSASITLPLSSTCRPRDPGARWADLRELVYAVDEAVLGAPALESDRLAAAAPAGLGHVVVALGATGAGERNERLRAVAGLAYKDVPVPHRRRTPGAVGPAHDDPPLCLYLRITNRISVLLAPCSSQSACRPSTGCRRCRGTQRAYLPSRKSTTAPSWRCLRTTWHTTPSSRPRRTRCPALTVFISPPYVSRSR